MSFKSSKGEEKIEQILKANKVKFEREVSFSDLSGQKEVLLRFDFAVFRYGKLFALIEFDGSPHFQYVKYFHKNIFNFRKAKERDRIKNAYCLRKGIPLIRIPYWELDNLTFSKIFSTPEFIVRDKFHNDYLINGGVNR